MKTASLTLAVALLASAALSVRSEDKADAPWFCHGLDCPEFTVKHTTDKFEIREYPKATWAGTKVESLLYSVGVSEGFQRLFKYISGDNEDDKKINMTVPVATHIVPGDGPFCKSKFNVLFFVPYKYQDYPPKPRNPDVEIVRFELDRVAVLQFGGFLVDDITLTSKAKALQKSLDDAGLNYDNATYAAVGYDPPTRLKDRHNEIWIRLLKNTTIPAEQSVVSS